MAVIQPRADTLQHVAPPLSCFSAMHLRRLSEMRQADNVPTLQTFSGAFMFLDMVSFTSLAEKLREKGVKGAEILSQILHDYYGAILLCIHQHGGDVLYFGGDALGVVWLSNDPAEAGLRAAACALQIQTLIPEIKSASERRLAFRAALGVGSMEALVAGGLYGNWLHLVRGEAIEQANLADKYSSGGLVAISAQSAKRLSMGGPVFSKLADGFLRIHSINHPLLPQPLPEIQNDQAEELLPSSGLTETVNRYLKAPGNIRGSEFRRTTVLFCDLSDTNPKNLNVAVRHSQEAAARFDGIVYSLAEDDKGTGLIIVFGIPGNTHADDPARAILLAQRLAADFADLNISLRIGISTGTAFCGPLGTEHRKYYSIIGSSINQAARLMSMAEQNMIYCDSLTRKLAGDTFAFRDAGWTQLKGFPNPVPVFEPGKQQYRGEIRATDTELVGRQTEIEAVLDCAEMVVGDHRSRLVVLRAGAGVGKSILMHKLREALVEKGLRTVIGGTDAFETETAYFAFRPVARHWCGIGRKAGANEAFASIRSQLADLPELLPLAPLLGHVMGLEFPETDLTRGLRGQVRADNTRRILLHFAAQRYAREPATLMIEDVHWMDGASWSFLDVLLDTIPALLVILSSRPLTETAGEAQRILDKDRVVTVDLQPISRVQTDELIRRQLGVTQVAEPMLDLVFDRAEGNPLFIKEIVNTLVETGAVEIQKSRADLATGKMGEIAIPETLNGVITSRIDRLPQDLQITIKTAAVLGRSFGPALLQAVHPQHTSETTLATQLVQLEKDGFLIHDYAQGDYSFHHALTRDAAYNLLSYAQREAVHHQTARALEQKFVGHTEQVHARLGYHFRMAGILDKAAHHLAAAGVTALDAYSSGDAVDLLTTALSLDEQFRGSNVGPDLARTYWCRLIGQAHYNLDNRLMAANWYRRAISEAGVAPRFKALGIIPTLVRAIVSPATLDRPPRPSLSAKDRERIAHGLGAASELGIIYLWQSALVPFALNAMNQVRIARIVGPTEETAVVIGTLAFLMSSGGLRRKSEVVALQSVRMAEDFGHTGQLVASLVMTGMVLTQNGQPHRGLHLFERADSISSELISGVWRHRCNFMLADAVMWLGQYQRAHDLFLATAELSRKAEPHTSAFAIALAALCQIRLGRPEKAVELLDRPDAVAYARECGVPTSAIACLGVLAEARFALGQKDAALAAAAEAERQVTAKDDGTGYYTGLFGYGSILNVRTQADPSFTTGEASHKALRHGLGKVRKIARVAPLANASLWLWQAKAAAGLGRARKARKLLGRSITAAMHAHQPFELGRSLLELARLSEGQERQKLLEQAIQVFEQHEMQLELASARSET